MPNLPSKMNAIVTTGHGGLEVLKYQQVDVPTPGPNDVIIKVAACGMNNTDVNTRSGWYSKEVTEATTGDAYESVGDSDGTWGGTGIMFPRIQGADCVGHVVAAGDAVDSALLGKRVMTDNWLRDWDDPLNMNKTGYFGSECDGGYAEYTKIDHRNVGVVNSDYSDAELATFSCSYTTAEGMLTRADVGADDVVLITGASGGVGSALIQLAKRRGATIVAMASDDKHAQVSEIGPDAIIPRAPDDLAAALRDAIGRDTVSVVADIVGGPYFANLIEALERGGRYTCAGAIAGPIVNLDLRTFYLNDLTFSGSTVVPPHIFRDVIGYIERAEVKPLLAATFPLRDLARAQEAFIKKHHTGNIVVTHE